MGSRCFGIEISIMSCCFGRVVDMQSCLYTSAAITPLVVVAMCVDVMWLLNLTIHHARIEASATVISASINKTQRNTYLS